MNYNKILIISNTFLALNNLSCVKRKSKPRYRKYKYTKAGATT